MNWWCAFILESDFCDVSGVQTNCMGVFFSRWLQISQPFPYSQSKVMYLWGWWLFCGALNCSQLLFLRVVLIAEMSIFAFW